MDPKIESAIGWFRRIYLDGIPVLLRSNDTAFLSFLCVIAAIDAVAGYRYQTGSEARFTRFIADYFPAGYARHAANLYVFRCRMLHNFSPAGFSLVHAQPEKHLQTSTIGDVYLDDASFFEHMRAGAERYFAELASSQAGQVEILGRLDNLARGGAIWVQG